MRKLLKTLVGETLGGRIILIPTLAKMLRITSAADGSAGGFSIFIFYIAPSWSDELLLPLT